MQMSRRLFDAVEVNVPCPNCGDPAKHTVEWLRMHKNVHCPHCGRRSEIDLEKAEQALKEAEEAWDNLLDRLGERRSS
jgi:sarcosine oxidase delta subunit